MGGVAKALTRECLLIRLLVIIFTSYFLFLISYFLQLNAFPTKQLP